MGKSKTIDQKIMKKSLLILVDSINDKKKAFADYISQEIPNIANVDITTFSDLIYEVDGRKISVTIDSLKRNITSYELVYFRRAGTKFSISAGNLGICLKHLGVKFFDTTFEDVGALGNKRTSYLKLSVAGLPTIPSIYCDPSKVNKYKKYIIKKLGLPLVVKELSVQRGEGVYLVKTVDDFSKLPKVDEAGKTFKYLFQKYLKNDEEYRILVLKNDIGAFERKIRTDPNEFRSNVALGAREEFLDVDSIPPVMKKIAVKAAKALKIQIAGVDILVDSKGKYWILEANRGPGLTYDLKVSPEFSNLAAFFAKELK